LQEIIKQGKEIVSSVGRESAIRSSLPYGLSGTENVEKRNLISFSTSAKQARRRENKRARDTHSAGGIHICFII